jgi:7,8-dihydroneopterin 2',3'-cyclic phosphate phosphodiesterase
MQKELKQLANQIKNPNLRKIALDLLSNPRTSLKDIESSELSLDASPAGKSQHHSYPKGLVEHTISTSKIAMALCDSVEKIYQGKINRDLVLAGVLLHDIFKPLTYIMKENGTYDISPLGEKLDHLTLILCELYQRKVPIDLLHIVAAHHGRSGPISPRTIEALIVHVADVADATLNGEILYAARSITRECVGEEVILSSSKKAFDIILAKQAKGCEGVRTLLKKM